MDIFDIDERSAYRANVRVQDIEDPTNVHTLEDCLARFQPPGWLTVKDETGVRAFPARRVASVDRIQPGPGAGDQAAT